MSKKPNYTKEQNIVIRQHGHDMLVSASAGAGKTTVMIERIAQLLLNNADVSEMVIVTFTNLAAGEMKARLIKKLSEKALNADGSVNTQLVRQLEKIDSASISTLHSFCGELLRNYFYAIDLDPAFAIFDEATANTLKNSALEDLIAEYFAKDDNEDFRQIYKIFASKRKEENFTKLILRLHAFSRCLVDFKAWHDEKKRSFSSKVANLLLEDVRRTVVHYRRALSALVEECGKLGLLAMQLALERNAEALNDINTTDFENAAYDFTHFGFVRIPNRRQPVSDEEEAIRVKYDALKKKLDDAKKKYSELLRVKDGVTFKTLWDENSHMVAYIDKLVELVCRFDEIYADYKRQRGGVDYDDLEHLALRLLTDNEAIRDEVRNRYKLVFVDEYQDTNPIQEAIIQAISTPNNLFMVGDVKQSIYGFRGCDPSIFTEKYKTYEKPDVKDPVNGWLVELNDNFRSNCDILNFVNQVFNAIMTNDFGKVDYEGSAQLKGNKRLVLPDVSTRVDILTKEKPDKQAAVGLYDVTATPDRGSVLTQGEVIARRIKEYVGKVFTIEETDEEGNVRRESKTIDYDDVVILMRGMKDKALDIYDTLRSYSIPVTAKFKADALQNKEIKDLINLFRVVDNPYLDVSMVGACLSVFGGFTEAELGHIRLDTEAELRRTRHGTDGQIFFYERLQEYAKNGKKIDLGSKITAFLAFIDDVRFYSRSASVDEVALYVIAKTSYNLHVQGLPSGEMRLKKLYAFIDSLKGLSYAQSIDKFLAYVDDVDDHRAEEAMSATGAVRMMTMHASKGLEFPIVFVAGLESRFNFDYFDVEQNNDVGLATRYYDFDKMQRADTLGFRALRLANERKQREEEMRLLYVAMTRAKYTLNLVLSQDDDDDSDGPELMVDKVKCHRDWILPIVEQLKSSGTVAHLDVQSPPQFACDLNANDAGVDGEKREVVKAKNGNGGANNAKSVEKIANGDKNSLPVAPTLSKREQDEVNAILAGFSNSYEYQAETTMPTKVVSSALDGEYFKRLNDESQTEQEAQPTEQVLEPNVERNLVGTAYHRLYENIFRDAAAKQKDGASIKQLIGSVNVDQLQNKVAELVAEGIIEQDIANEIDVNLVYDTLYNPDLLELLEGGVVHPEKPFMLSIPYKEIDENKLYRDNVILQGVIDLLVVKSDSAVVVDFKYTLHKDRITDNYRLQLKSYKLAVQRILGIRDVDAYVLSIRDKELIPM